MPILTLSGCAPVPLAHYLKALGIFRLIAESKDGDASATAFWKGDRFILNSRFGPNGESQITEFFLRDYCPTPLMVPWSGGDFFAVNREKPTGVFDNTPTSSLVIEAILSTSSPRLEPYRTALRATFTAMDQAGVKVKKDIEGSGGPQRRLKAEMLNSLRGSLPDNALAWMDAAAVIEPGTLAFNTMLGGGGGSDGNSHFSDNFMQCLWMALHDFDAQRKKLIKAIGNGATFDSPAALNESLFGVQGTGTKVPGLSPVLFDSTRVGGPNQTTGFEAKAGSNPWDFIFMLEGSVLFAGAIGRKLDDNRGPSARFPFLFQASPVGLGSSYLGESSGRELWLPLWAKPASLAEIRALLAEGRIEKHGRMAKRGTDAFVAAAQLGFDRGVASFQRIGFFKGRIGGDNYFTAIDQGRITPRRNQSVDLLRDVDDWLTRLAAVATSDKCPASVASKVVTLERKIADLTVASQEESSSRLIAVLAALGATERTLARSFKWGTENIRPLHGLRPEWLKKVGDDSKEFRLAASLAGLRGWLGAGEGKGAFWLRQQLEPVDIFSNQQRCWISWDKTPGNDVAWHEGHLTDSLNAILARRIQRVEKAGVAGWPDWSPHYAKLDDITAFIEQRTDDTLLADLLWGLSLLDWQAVAQKERNLRDAAAKARELTDSAPESDDESSADDDEDDIPPINWHDENEDRQQVIPSSFYALLKLCFRRKDKDGAAIPLVPAIHQRASMGDGLTASRLAARRLLASGEAPLVRELDVTADTARRTAAALIFPIHPRDIKLLKLTLQHQPKEQHP